MEHTLIEFCDILLTLIVCNGRTGSNTQEYALHYSGQCLGHNVFHNWIRTSMRQDTITSVYWVIFI